MFDTVAISTDIYRPPDFDLLIENGCVPFYSRYNGEPYKLVLNGQEGAKEPRITISKNPVAARHPFAAQWIMRIEVSIGAWLKGSNIYLPTLDDIPAFLSDFSDFVYFKTGIFINAANHRMPRLDVTKDFRLGDVRMMEVIKALSFVILPKYDRRPFNDTSIAFENKGKKKNKLIKVYSKYHDLQNKGASEQELETAKGVMRLESQNKDNRAVTNMANSLKLPDHSAGKLLTLETHERVIEKTIKILGLDTLLNSPEDKLQRLSKMYGSEMALKLTGHLYHQSKYGSDYGELPFNDLSPKTLKEYDRKCRQAGISSLE